MRGGERLKRRETERDGTDISSSRERLSSGSRLVYDSHEGRVKYKKSDGRDCFWLVIVFINVKRDYRK